MFSIILLIVSSFMLIINIGILAARSYIGEFDPSEDFPLVVSCFLTIANMLLIIFS